MHYHDVLGFIEKNWLQNKSAPAMPGKNNTDITSLTAVSYDGKSSSFTTIVGFLVFKRSYVVKHINFAFPPFSKNTSHE